MNAGLKQRLVGAVVLVALAVIFLPMLLDGSGAREQMNENIAIPEKPEPPESQLGDPETQFDATATQDSSQTAYLDDPGATEEPGTGTADGGDAGAVDAQGDNGAATGGDDTAEASGEEPGSADAGAATGENTATADTTESGWIVQVGSFRRETNALVLRDKLRESGFDSSHTERVQNDGRTLWRVLVGPVAERGDGEALQRRIEEQREGDTLLMKHP